MTALLVVDDDSVARTTIPEYFSSLEYSVYVAKSGREACLFLEDAAVDDTSIDVVLCDIRMPDMSGIEFTRIISGFDRAPAILGMTAFDEDALIMEMLRSGAVGVLLKSAGREEFLRGVSEAAASRGYLSPSIARRIGRYLHPLMPPHERRPLSLRQREVLDLVLQGFSNAEIGKRLHLSVSGVKVHLSALFDAFGVDSRLKLVVAALSR